MCDDRDCPLGRLTGYIKRLLILALPVAAITVYPAVSPAGGNLPPVAVAEASLSEGDAPLLVMFRGTGSSDPDSSFISYSWDFADGHVDFGGMVSHRFEQPGVYQVTLTVTDAQGLSATQQLTVTVK